jgi:hypothetical protein
MDSKSTRLVETWRLDRLYDDYAEAVHALMHRVAEPWGRLLQDIAYSTSYEEVRSREYDLVTALCEQLQPDYTLPSSDGKDRAPCPLCGDTTQNGEGFALPVGMNRHLTHFSGCTVLRLVTRLGRMNVNRELDRPFYGPYDL